MILTYYVLVDYGSFRARIPGSHDTTATTLLLRNKLSKLLDSIGVRAQSVQVRLYHGFTDENGTPARETKQIDLATKEAQGRYGDRVFDWTLAHTLIRCPSYQPPTLVNESLASPSARTSDGLECRESECALEALALVLRKGECPEPKCDQVMTNRSLVRQKQGPVDALLQVDLLSLAHQPALSSNRKLEGIIIVTEDRDLIPSVVAAHTASLVPIHLALPNMRLGKLHATHPGLHHSSLQLHRLNHV